MGKSCASDFIEVALSVLSEVKGEFQEKYGLVND